MDAISLLAQMKKSFLDEGIVDEQFVNLEELEGPANPKFLQEVMNSYYEEAKMIIESVEDELYEYGRPNVYKMEKLLHQLKVQCESVGALRVKNAVNEMRRCLIDNDYEICTAAISAVKETQENMQSNLDKYFKLKEQVLNASTPEEQEREEEEEDDDDDDEDEDEDGDDEEEEDRKED